MPKLQAAGWEDEPHRINEQRTFTDGRIVVAGRRSRRRPGKRADYILRYRPDLAIAVVEAKPDYATPGEGLQQAKEYAEILGLKFAYATNGHGIVEFDYITGLEREIEGFPTPDELWSRLTDGESLTPEAAGRLLTPAYHLTGMSPHYYQEIAINRAVQTIAQGKPRALLTMATGTGKTFVAFQICWKLWSSRWNRTGDYRRPRILYLADRNILIDDPMAKTFAPFGDARWKIENGQAVKSREQYTNTQSLHFAEFEPCLKWWKKREENERAWKVKAADILENGCNLDIKNPSAKQDFEHLPPEKLADDILQKELRIAEIMQEIKQLLQTKP